MFHNFGPYGAEKYHRKDHFQYFPEGIVTSERVLEDNESPGIIHMLEGLTTEEKQQYVQS